MEAITKQMENRRLESLRKKKFSSRIQSPFVLGSVAINTQSANGLILPEAAVIGISSSNAVSQGQLLLYTNRGRIVGTPNLAANQIWRSGFFEKGLILKVLSTVARSVSLHYLDDRRKPFIIANGSFV